MKKFFSIACLLSLLAANSQAQTVVPTAGAMSFSAFLENDIAIAFTNSNFQGTFSGRGRNGSVLPIFGAGLLVSCTYAGTQVYPDMELAYNFNTYPGYFKMIVFTDKESTTPYMTCEGTQAPAVYAKLKGVGKFYPK